MGRRTGLAMLWAVLPGVLLPTAVACGPPEDPAARDAVRSEDAVTVTSCGRRLTFAAPPERVVTLDQSSTETLLALGAADRMAGTSNLKTQVAPRYQAAYEQVPVLSPTTLTGERLRAAAPDLVVSSFEALYTPDKVGTREELARLGVPSYVSAVECPDDSVPARGEEGVDDGGAGPTREGDVAIIEGAEPFELLFQDYRNLGEILGVQDRAERLIAQQRRVLQEAAALRRDMTGTPSIVWLYSTIHGLPYVAGAGGMPSAMSRLIGAENAFDDVPEQWPEVSWEQIVQRNPDVLVVGDLSERGAPGDSAEEKIAMLRREPAVSRLEAVREGRIIQVPGIEMDPSVRTVHTLRLLMDGMRELGHVR